jgi:hypothetical protein
VSVRALQQQGKVRVLFRAEARIQLIRFRPELQGQASDIQESPSLASTAPACFSHELDQIVQRALKDKIAGVQTTLKQFLSEAPK